MDRSVNGRTQLILGCLLTIFTAGCDDALPPTVPTSQPPPLGESFDPATAGTIRGEACWSGVGPHVPRFRAPVNPNGEAAFGRRQDWSNPNAPVIDKEGRLSGAVVFLRQIDPKRSRPWDLPPVRVEMREYDYRVRQEDAESRTGFVRRGATVEFVSRQPVFHSLRARGDAFFTLAFPDADQVRSRVLDRPGVVELSSAAGYFWARAYLFVAEHPYYTRTDDAGRFTLPQVPPGEYELVCWLPDWHEKDHELDADSWQVSRLTFRPPVEVTQKIVVIPGTTAEMRINMPAERFAP
jgi:hypothetical protein